MNDKPRGWRFWHPHQGLWNWDLLRQLERALPGRLYRISERAIILADTALLWARAVARRTIRLGPAALFAVRKAPESVQILYFDLGTHRAAGELAIMLDAILPRAAHRIEAYGFEACPEYFEEARQRLASRRNVTLVNKALVHRLPEGGRVTLYLASGKGLGTSLYRDSYARREEVAATRFSDWLGEMGFDLRNSICLLRMNIEGAEYDVVSDLVERGLADCFDGYYGMWDDVGKIDPGRDREFRRLLSTYRIRPMTFNGRDLPFALRLRCIAYDVRTSVEAGLRRLERGSREEPARKALHEASEMPATGRDSGN